VKRYIDDGAPPNPALHAQAITRILQQYRDYPGFGLFAVHQRDDGDFLGWFHFRLDHEMASDTDLGYRLMQKVWGRGYATEASRALIARGFLQQAVTRVIARALLANTASWGVMEKLGMKRIQEFEEQRFPGADKRSVKYALTRDEFIQQAQKQ
jgi:RimJ/RimL family protein N-acetyltransferase